MSNNQQQPGRADCALHGDLCGQHGELFPGPTRGLRLSRLPAGVAETADE
jgi:hypothetical protein